MRSGGARPGVAERDEPTHARTQPKGGTRCEVTRFGRRWRLEHWIAREEAGRWRVVDRAIRRRRRWARGPGRHVRRGRRRRRSRAGGWWRREARLHVVPSGRGGARFGGGSGPRSRWSRLGGRRFRSGWSRRGRSWSGRRWSRRDGSRSGCGFRCGCGFRSGGVRSESVPGNQQEGSERIARAMHLPTLARTLAHRLTPRRTPC